MKPTPPTVSAGILLEAGMVSSVPVQAADRDLQAIFLTSGCAPSKIVSTRLGSGVTTYEVTCKGTGTIINIMCRETECIVRPKRRENGEK